MHINKLLRKAYLFEYKSLLSLAAFDTDQDKEVFYLVFNQFLLDNGFSNIDMNELEDWLKLNKNILDQMHVDSLSLHIDNNLLTGGSTRYNPYTDIAISTSHQDLKTHKLIQEGVLQKTKHIPNLYIIEYHLKKNLENDEWSHSLNKENAFYAPLLQAIKHTSYFPDNVLYFINENKAILDQIKSQCSKNPILLGKGMDGAVFDIGQSRVLKFFTSTVAYNNALKAFDRLHKSTQIAKNEAMIYDIGQINLYSNNRKKIIYYYIMEKMPFVISNQSTYTESTYNTIASIIREHYMSYPIDQIKMIKSKVESDPEFISNFLKTESQIIKGKVKSEFKKNPNKLLSFKKENNLNDDWLRDFIQEMLFKILTDRKDLHSGNIGATNYGKLRFFDPSFG